MTIMGQDPEPTGKVAEGEKQTGQPAAPAADAPNESEQTGGAEKVNIFAEANLKEKSEVEAEKEEQKDGSATVLTIMPEDKLAFIDSVVQNKRFTKDYAIFGGKVKLTLRSLTTDEVNALSCWILKQGSSDSAGLLSGRYRKYLAAAQVAELNGTRMNPLEDPLFETVGNDGKSVDGPGWLSRAAYWDGMADGLFTAVLSCIKDFDALYAALCKKAFDANFWNPDTP